MRKIRFDNGRSLWYRIDTMNQAEQIAPSSTDSPPQSFTTPEFRRLLDQCIHCGLCLPACPTYAVFHTEMDNPRGRIALMHGVADGRVDIASASFQTHMDLCLGCRACETACPSGVQYGALFEVARTAMQEDRQQSGRQGRWETFVRWLALRQLLMHPARLRILARLLRVYQRLGLSRWLRKTPILPAGLRTMETLLPELSMDFPDYGQPAPAMGEKRGEVIFLHGCVQDAFLSQVNADTVRVLQRNGYTVHTPPHQTCCGAAPLHIGEREIAREMARRNLDAVAHLLPGCTAVLTNAGGCGATLKEYAHLLHDDPAYAALAAVFVHKMQDVTEFLAAHLHVPPRGELPVRTSYVDSCHLRHAQRVVQPPRALLAAIPGLQLVELQRPDLCCGSAGVYNILQSETADQVLDAKMADVAATEPHVIVTTNTGCHMQMVRGVREAGLDAEVLHLVQLLERAYQVDR
jgi:glycolate oxidase iron-sulfur subunit